MTINERTNAIKDYFVGLNVQEGIAYVVVKFPRNKNNIWQVPSEEFLKQQYKVSVGSMDNGGTVFATEFENGMDTIFDAIDYTVAFNKEAMERTEILRAKINELQEIFATEDIDKLRTLTFTFGKAVKGKGKNKKTEQPVTEQDITTISATTDPTVTVTLNPVSNSPAEAQKGKGEENDNSLMELAKAMTAE